MYYIMTKIRMSIDVNQELHKIIKTQATLNSLSIKEYVTQALKSQLKKERILSKDTIKAIEDSDLENNLNKYETLEDLYEKSGI